ncbi:GerAB/ArcD/ProY family transporter [Paenibacillus aestuarii]|uniref:GerAB/ArcD/ProY family transporter n=1 Tax=Paenibacillus aestuarii TaxID=516965 RepID=A0ABW0KIG4_9BACL|nr:GerAB/ArcD/ProY family transporter [Paenibacillus aestuarii]
MDKAIMDKSHYVMLMYLIMHFGLIFFMYPENIIASTDAVHWIAILSGLAVQLIFIAVYMKGLNFFPGRDIIDIYSSTGLGVSLLFLLPIALYFLMVNIITIRAYSEIISIVFLSNTPLWAIMILLLLVATYIAGKGVETIFRTGLLLGLLFLPLILLIFLASFQNVDWNYVFPLYENDFSFWTKPDYYQSFFAFAGSFLFLGFVRPHFPYKDKKVYLTAAALIHFFVFSVYVPVLTEHGGHPALPLCGCNRLTAN